jgi:IS5 family transposase
MIFLAKAGMTIDARIVSHRTQLEWVERVDRLATIAETRGFVHDLRERNITPHVAINAHLTKTGKRRTTSSDGRTLRHAGYGISQRCRKRIEEVFGWLKTTGGIARVKVRGLAKVQAVFTFAIVAYNLVRIQAPKGTA